MSLSHLWSPWRLKYIISPKNKDCIFCLARDSESDAEKFVISRSPFNMLLLNTYPYNNAHIMIAPLEHIASPELAGKEILDDQMEYLKKALEALKKEYNPEGFNIGMNLGKIAGAGVEDHFHLHIVPRWSGDTNFMTTISQTRVVPEEPERTYQRLKIHF